MKQQIIMPTLPNMGLISVLSKTYDILTDEFIQRWLYQLYNDHMIDPEYLFVSNAGRRELRTALENMPEARWFARTGRTVDDLVSCYPNKGTGTMLHVVVLPTLAENTLLVGNLVLHEEEG